MPTKPAKSASEKKKVDKKVEKEEKKEIVQAPSKEQPAGEKKKVKTGPVQPKRKRPAFYHVDPIKKRLPSNRSKHNPPGLRKSIEPGTVLILLAGRFRGKRVVFLKQLTSGLLLVTGPYKINGVPLRRVNQKYVIATTTKVLVKSETKFEDIDDSFFAKEKTQQVPKSKEDEFFYNALKKPDIPEGKKSKQKQVDGPLLKTIEETQMLFAYLNARFTLSRHDRPHELKF
jgi:large subunit ribosomal protein L6e